jgi:hypothetical protein
MVKGAGITHLMQDHWVIELHSHFAREVKKLLMITGMAQVTEWI